MNRLRLVLLALLAALVGCGGGDASKPLLRVGDREIPADAHYAKWWAQAAACIGIDTTYDQKLRYFVGDVLPREWGGERGAIYLGYTNPYDHMILLERGAELDSAIIVHEQLHDFAGYGHPKKYFGDAVAARCGYAPGHD